VGVRSVVHRRLYQRRTEDMTYVPLLNPATALVLGWA
jgi:hypothetical protein